MALQYFTAEGMPLLSDQYLRRRIEILLAMLQVATVQECAIISGASRYGQGDRAKTLKQLLPKLSEQDLRAFFEIAREAFMSRARQPEGAALFALSEEENIEVFKQIRDQIPETERQLWVDQLARLETLNDKAYCSASRLMYQAILKIPEENQSKALRMEFAR